jgi:hypothetical protein
MIYYTFIESESKLQLLLHSEKKEFIGIAEADFHNNENILEVKRVGARYQTATIAYKALAAYCTHKNLNLMSNRNNDEFGWRAKQHWDAFFKGYYKSEKKMLPSNMLIETKDKSRNYSYGLTFEKKLKSLVDEGYFDFEKFSSIIDKKNITEETSELLENGTSILNYLYKRKGNKTLYDKFPIPDANHITGTNINTLWDMKQVTLEYTSGRCMYLSIALNELYGYEIQMHVDKYREGMIIEHAWVETSTEENFDITGYINKDDEWTGSGTTLKKVTKDDIYDFMSLSKIYDNISKENFEQNVLLAQEVINNYVLIYFPELSILKNVKKLDNNYQEIIDIYNENFIFKNDINAPKLENNFESIKKLFENYACADFAFACHKETGWKVFQFDISKIENEEHPPYHVVVQNPDTKMFFDINGYSNKDDIIKKYNGKIEYSDYYEIKPSQMLIYDEKQIKIISNLSKDILKNIEKGIMKKLNTYLKNATSPKIKKVLDNICR